MDHDYFVYILTDKSRSTLYIGITNDLVTRLWQRASFSQRYRYILLMHVEHHGDVKRGHRTGETAQRLEAGQKDRVDRKGESTLGGSGGGLVTAKLVRKG